MVLKADKRCHDFKWYPSQFLLTLVLIFPWKSTHAKIHTKMANFWFVFSAKKKQINKTVKSDKLALTEGKILNLMFLDIYIPVVPVKNWLRATHNQRQKNPKVASVLLFRHILKTTSWLECGSSLLNSRMWPGIDAAEQAKYVLLSSPNKYTNQDHHLCTLPKNDGELKNSKTAACRISRLYRFRF